MAEMDVLIFIAVGAAILLILLVGGRAERFNLRGLMRPSQPTYRENSKHGPSDGG